MYLSDQTTGLSIKFNILLVLKYESLLLDGS